MKTYIWNMTEQINMEHDQMYAYMPRDSTYA